MMKQFLFKDPYADVTFGGLFWVGLWKIGLFYGALISTVWLYRTAAYWRMFVILVVALLGNMVLAVTFEGGSPERYFPLYPFLFIVAALCLCDSSVPRISRACITLLFVVIIAGNLPAFFAKRVLSDEKRAVQRIGPLLPLRPASYVFFVGDDPVGWLLRNAPFGEINLHSGFHIVGVYDPMIRTSYWRRDFAATVLSTWEQGGDTWVTTRVWSDRPLPEWGWVEGDDPNVGWEDVARFFRPIEHGDPVGGTDGFVLLSRSAENYNRLTLYAKTLETR